MKKILVPVDFSPCSYDAFQYAKEVAQILGFSIKVVNVYTETLNTDESLLIRSGKTIEQTINEQLKEFVNKKMTTNESETVLTKVKIETEATLAVTISHQIIQLTNDPEITMVIMGKTGASNLIDRMLGSISSAIAQKANCPVLLIPEGLKFQAFNNVLYASNFESIDEDKLQQVIDFGKVFNAGMHFVHIQEDDKYQKVENTIFNKLFEKGDPIFAFNIVNLKGASVMKGLTQYAKENDVDLIVLVNRKRYYFDNFFKISLTKKMALNSSFPLMVFHLD